MNTFPWTIFFSLLAAGILGTAAVLPYSLSINNSAIEKMKEAAKAQSGVGGKRPLPLPVMIALGLVQNVIMFAIAIFAGLLAGRQVGLGMPILQGALASQPVGDQILAMLPEAVMLGVVSSLLIMLIEAVIFLPRIPRSLSGMDGSMAFWKRMLACFYGGIGEEILLRLFLMGGLVWLLGLVWHEASGSPAQGAFWTANIIAALLFGAGHLPATSAVAKLTPIVVTRALLLNGVIGVACGYLYMKYGLEAAMVAHFSADIVIHLITPPVMRRVHQALPAESAAQPA